MPVTESVKSLPPSSSTPASLQAPAGAVGAGSLKPLLRAPCGVWLHLHTRRYYTLTLICKIPTRQGVLTQERRA